MKNEKKLERILKDLITLLLDESDEDCLEAIEQTRVVTNAVSPLQSQPVDLVRWVPIDKVEPNDYNPNSVASKEMGLLYTSILHDGYTQPIVTIYDKKLKKYIIVDGFHRYFIALQNTDISERNHGLLPIVVIDKSINERMASTIRHNRARGSHSVDGMASMVFSMLDQGWEDADICNHLGMEADELVRLKHITGFSKLFEDTEYKQSWVTRKQIKAKKQYANNSIQETSDTPKS